MIKCKIKQEIKNYFAGYVQQLFNIISAKIMIT
jgi:hypothetical protein